MPRISTAVPLTPEYLAARAKLAEAAEDAATTKAAYKDACDRYVAATLDLTKAKRAMATMAEDAANKRRELNVRNQIIPNAVMGDEDAIETLYQLWFNQDPWAIEQVDRIGGVGNFENGKWMRLHHKLIAKSGQDPRPFPERTRND